MGNCISACKEDKESSPTNIELKDTEVELKDAKKDESCQVGRGWQKGINKSTQTEVTQTKSEFVQASCNQHPGINNSTQTGKLWNKCKYVQVDRNWRRGINKSTQVRTDIQNAETQVRKVLTQTETEDEPAILKKSRLRAWIDGKVPLAKQPQGIVNLGNTCYMNSVLQVLCWTPKLGKKLAHQLMKNNSNEKNGMTPWLFDLISATHTGGCIKETIPRRILNEARTLNSQFYGHHQEDSFELFNTIISGIETEAKEAMMSHSPISELVEGKFITVFRYETCGHIETEVQEFTSLSIPVTSFEAYRMQNISAADNTRSDGYNACFQPLQTFNGCHTGVELGLLSLTDIEDFDENVLKCRTCDIDGNGRTQKRVFVISSPQILVLHINKFKQVDNYLVKMDQTVTYPKVLNLAPFCSNAASMEEIGVHRNNDMSYKLYGVVSHTGSLQGGHYTAFVRASDSAVNLRNNIIFKDLEYFRQDSFINFWRNYNTSTLNEQCKDTWFNVSDSFVESCTEKVALEDKNAYMLLYERI